MKLVVDECVPVAVIDVLRSSGHEVAAIRDLAPGASDDEVLQMAVELADPLVTEDLDFGEMVFRQSRTSVGVIMLRLAGLSNARKALILLNVLHEPGERVPGAFVVLTPGAVRIRSSTANS